MRPTIFLLLATLTAGNLQAQLPTRSLWDKVTSSKPSLAHPSTLRPTAPQNSFQLVRRAQGDPEIISTTPQGTLFDNTYNSSSAFYQTPFGMAMETTMDGNTVSIDVPQYLGPDMIHGYHLYAFGDVSEIEAGEDGRPQEHTYLGHHLSFSYDSSDASFSSDSVLVLNMGKRNSITSTVTAVRSSALMRLRPVSLPGPSFSTTWLIRRRMATVA